MKQIKWFALLVAVLVALGTFTSAQAANLSQDFPPGFVQTADGGGSAVTGYSPEAVASRYVFTDTVGTYTEIISGTVHGTASNDDTSFTAIDIGFTFYFDGLPYTQVSINSNGFIAMGASVSSSYIPISGGTTNNVIVALGRDLQGNGTTSVLRSYTEGTAPNRVLTIQWTDYKRYGTAYAGDAFDFQIRLHETSNLIEIVYGPFTAVYNAAPPTIQVGLRGASNADFNNRTTLTDWSASAAGTLNTDVMTLTDLIFPASGLTYTWTPQDMVVLDPNYAGGVCRGGWLDYPLTAQNSTSITDTLNITATGYTWPTLFYPPTLNLGPQGSGNVTASVYVPWAAAPGSQDTAVLTATGQTSGLFDNAYLETTSAMFSGYTDYTDIPVGREVRAPGVVYWDGKIYKIGGYGYPGGVGGAQAWLDIYDIATNTWSAGADMPGVRYWLDCEAIDLTGSDAKIYCAGGYSTSGQSTLYIYDISDNSWTTGAALPAARYNYASVVHNNLYYVIGGYTTGYQATMLVYDPAANTWDSTKASMATARRYFHAGVIGDKIYVSGGYNPTYLATGEVYDIATNAWTPIASMPSTWVNAADGVLYDRYLVLTGGHPSSTSGASNGAMYYDAVTDTWDWLPLLDRMLYSAEGAGDGTHFWTVSGRMYTTSYANSPYTTLLDECADCVPVSGVDFTVDPAMPRPTRPVVFTASVAGGSPAIDYFWEFGDGNYGYVDVFTHTYALTGTYVVTLTAFNCDGATWDQITKTVEVEAGAVIGVSPDALSSTQCADTQTTQQLSICNEGDQALTWTLSELAPTLLRLPPAVNLPDGPAQANPGLMLAGPSSTVLALPAAPESPESVLWDQPLSAVNPSAYVDQHFPDSPTFSSFLADDFVSADAWSIDSFFVPGDGWNGFTTILNATALHWEIYTDNAGVPAGDPANGGAIWSLVLPPTDPQVVITNGTQGYPSNVQLNLAAPLVLPPGHYWFVFFPEMPFTGGGQYGRQPADTANGAVAQFINPGGGFGLGTAWQAWNVLSVSQTDLAFRIEGNIYIDNIPWLSETPLAGTVAAGECALVDVTFDSTGLVPDVYTGTLEIASNDTETPLVQVPVELIVPGAPTNLGFTWNPLSPILDETVDFSGSADALLPVTFGWDFGDGITATGQSASHAYSVWGDYEVTMTAELCGYSEVVTDTLTVQSCWVVTTEDFESTFPPAGWTVENYGGTCVWQRNDAFATLRPNYAGGDGFAADADSDKCGSGSSMDTGLVSSALDFTGAITATLRYMTSYNDIGAGGDLADTDISLDGGVTWINLQRWDEDHSPNGPGEAVSLDLTPYVSESPLLRFHYHVATYDWWWMVDQIEVVACYVPGAGPEIEVTPAELAQTLYTDQTAEQPLNIANVGLLALDWSADVGCGSPIPWLGADPLAGSVAPGLDTDVTVTFDSTGLGVGTYNAPICITSNDPLSPTITVNAVLTVTPSADITVTPDSLWSEQLPDEIVTQTLEICNLLGTAPLDWALSEVSSVPPLAAAGPVSVPAPKAEPAIMRLADGSVDCAAYANYALREPAEVAVACGSPAITGSGAGLLSPTDMGYAQDIGYISDNFVNFPLGNFTGQTVVGTNTNAYYAMDFDPSATTLYAIDDTTDMLGTIDLATGAFTPLVSCPAGGGAANWSGMSIDPVTGVFYGSTATDLYIIDPATGLSTLVGPFNAGGTMIDIAVNAQSEMYGHDITSDSIYSINIATGAATLVGPTGLAANYAQGMDFDNEDGTLYIFAYTGSGTNTYGTVNLATGAVTPLAVSAPLGEFEGATQTVAFMDIPWLAEAPITGTVAMGTCETVDVTFDSTGLAAGDYFAALKVTSNDPNEPQIFVPVTLTVISPVDLGITKVADLAMVDVGDVLEYTIEVTNYGADASAVTVFTDTLPASFDFLAASDGCVEDMGEVVCPVGVLATTETAVFTITVSPTAPGEYENVVVLLVPDDDSDPSNDADNEWTDVGPAYLVYDPTSFHSTQYTNESDIWYTLEVCNLSNQVVDWTLEEDPALLRAYGPQAPADLSEGFDDITLLTDWFFQNNSSPLGVTNWFQGNDTVFPAYTGAPTSYIGANFNNTAGVGTISNWMLTPEMSLNDGDTVSFWTRSTGGSWPDRLEVRLSTAGASTNVGTLATDVGDFTTVLVEVNPTLAVGGYPDVWTQYTATLSGIPAGTTGRIGFRYFVTNGGPSGSASDYIGIDEFEYTSAVVTGIPWLSEDPIMGSLNGGECGVITVTFDSTGLPVGEYYGDLLLNSDDPYVPQSTIPVTLTVIPMVDLGVTKLDDPDPVVSGNEVEYTIEVTNFGPDASTGATLVDTLPEGFDFVAATLGCVEVDGEVTCPVGALALDETATFTITVLAVEPGLYTNNVTVIGNESDPNTDNDTATAETTVTGYMITFVYHDLEDVVHDGDSLYLAGDMNDWNTAATEMLPNLDFSVFTVTLELGVRDYGYKYVVDADQVHWNWLQTDNRLATDITLDKTIDDHRNITALGYYELWSPDAVTVTVGTSTGDIEGWLWIDDLTPYGNDRTSVAAELGYGMAADPATWTTWAAMAFDRAEINNVMYIGQITPMAVGVYDYAIRFNPNWGVGNPNGLWFYADTVWDEVYNAEDAGVLTVTEYIPPYIKIFLPTLHKHITIGK